MTVYRVTNIESQSDDNEARITTFDKENQEHLNAEYHFIVEGDKGNPKDWSEHPFDRNPDFQEEFIYVVSDEEVEEADDEFSPYVYDDTYLSMNLALPERGELEPQFALVAKRLRNTNGLPIVKASENHILVLI